MSGFVSILVFVVIGWIVSYVFHQTLTYLSTAIEPAEDEDDITWKHVVLSFVNLGVAILFWFIIGAGAYLTIIGR